jgi:hypothetical protein
VREIVQGIICLVALAVVGVGMVGPWAPENRIDWHWGVCAIVAIAIPTHLPVGALFRRMLGGR